MFERVHVHYTKNGAAHRECLMRSQHRSLNRTRPNEENFELVVRVLVCDNRTARAGRGNFPHVHDARSAFARDRSGSTYIFDDKL